MCCCHPVGRQKSPLPGAPCYPNRTPHPAGILDIASTPPQNTFQGSSILLWSAIECHRNCMPGIIIGNQRRLFWFFNANTPSGLQWAPKVISALTPPTYIPLEGLRLDIRNLPCSCGVFVFLSPPLTDQHHTPLTPQKRATLPQMASSTGCGTLPEIDLHWAPDAKAMRDE